MSLTKYLGLLFCVLGLGQASDAPGLVPQGQEVEVTIFYSSDICGYLEPCG